MNCGIYIITNKRNNKFYIGRSKNIKNRLKGHKYLLNKGIHNNQYLQNAWNKDFEYFEFDILELTKEEFLESIENYWIIMTNCNNRNIGYNIESSGYNGAKSLSDETKKKISIKAKGRKRSKDTIIKTSLKNKGQIRESQSLYMKERWEKGEVTSIWENLSEDKKIITKKKLSDSVRKRYSNIENLPKSSKKVKFINCKKEEIIYPSINYAEKSLNLSNNYLKSMLNGQKSKFIKRLNGIIEII